MWPMHSGDSQTCAVGEAAEESAEREEQAEKHRGAGVEGSNLKDKGKEKRKEKPGMSDTASPHPNSMLLLECGLVLVRTECGLVPTL